ncbi:unnamed protein product [Paramecium octaurelia]|uniref:Uncharacterized protein n=1 Tax=Paramecium octaurelia TaxID=43137 RepID=A0A8S1XYK4_PAROT|nr:unnamed protein product [Paramecium octaurelia]
MSIIVLLTLFVFGYCDQKEAGLQKVKVQVATVLDGYYKEFDGILCYSEKYNQFVIYHERSKAKNLKELFPETDFFLQFGMNGNVVGLSLQNFAPQLIINEDQYKSVVFTVKPEVKKGTTLKIAFVHADYEGEQERFIDLMENGLSGYTPISETQLDFAAMQFEHKFIQYVKKMHDEL